jgi:hypothetical protein
MFTALAISVGVVLMAVAYWVHGRLDSMLSKVEVKVQPYMPGVKQKFTAAAQYAKPRATGWARRLALGCVAHVAVFFGAATCVALVKPAPQTLSYGNVAIKDEATWYQRGMAYASLNTGLGVREVRPGFLFSTATLNNGSVLIGLPGTGRWYRL